MKVTVGGIELGKVRVHVRRAEIIDRHNLHFFA